MRHLNIVGSAVIAGEYALCRVALRNLLESEAGIRVTGEATAPAELIDLVRDHSPDIVVFEQSLPNCSAADALTCLAGLHGAPPLLILIEASELPTVPSCFQGETVTVLPKSTDPRQLIDCVRAMTDDPGYSASMFGAAAKPPWQSCTRDDPYQNHKANSERLTASELRIVEILERGASNKRIASALGIAEQTVKNHLRNLYRRFGARNRLELVLSPSLIAAKAESKRTTFSQPTTAKTAQPINCPTTSRLRPPGGTTRFPIR